MNVKRGKRRHRLPAGTALLTALLFLAGCGAKSDPPAAVPTPTAAVTAVPASTVMAAGLFIAGTDGQLRAEIAVGIPQSEWAGQLALSYRVKNESSLSLTRLRLELNALDADGKLLNRTAIPVTFSFLEEPLRPGEEREIAREHYFTGAERTASVQLMPLGVENEQELPPWTAPQPNNLLPAFCNDPQLSARFAALDTDPPVLLRYQQDQEPVLELTDPELIRAAAAALSHVRIGTETGRNVDDGGFTYTFVMSDGAEWGFHFDFRDLLYWHGKNYEVLDAKELLALQPEE